MFETYLLYKPKRKKRKGKFLTQEVLLERRKRRKRKRKLKKLLRRHKENRIDYRNDERWIKQRKKCYRRDNYTCQHCGATKIKVFAHHTTYVHKLGSKKELDKLITLCGACHNKFHKMHKYNGLEYVVRKKYKT